MASRTIGEQSWREIRDLFVVLLMANGATSRTRRDCCGCGVSNIGGRSVGIVDKRPDREGIYRVG